MTDVIVEVQGGVVQSVAANGKNVRVVVIDWDNIECDPREKKRPEWARLQKLESLAPEALELYQRLAKK